MLGKYNEDCGVREPRTAVRRMGCPEHWTNLLFQPTGKPGLSLFSSCVFKYVFSYVLSSCVPGDLVWCCCALLHPGQSWPGGGTQSQLSQSTRLEQCIDFIASERFSLSFQVWVGGSGSQAVAGFAFAALASLFL